MATQTKRPTTIIAALAIAALLAVGLLFGTGVWNGSLGSAGSSERSAAVQGDTVTIVDSVGRTVTVPATPQHIAAADAFSGDVAVLCGAGDRVDGVPGGVRSNVLLQKLCPDLADKQQLSGSTINVETLMNDGVDVVLVRSDLYQNSAEMAKLDKVGIPYVVVDYDDVDSQIDAIRLVGQVCGGDAGTRAEALADYYRATVDDVEARAAQIPADQRISVYHSINDPLLTDGAGSLGADWIARTGAIDVSAGEASTGGQGDYTATLEQIYAWNPQVIICSTADARTQIAGDVQWSALGAVESGALYNLPVSTSRWGQRGDPETFLGMLWLGKTLYPDQYADVDLKETVVAYYRDVIGLDIDDGTWDQIVAGTGLRTQGSGSGGGSGTGSGQAGTGGTGNAAATGGR